MTDYNELIERLISEANDTKYMLGHASSLHTAAADAIKGLVAERDDALTRMEGLVNNLSFRISEAKDWKDRAEKEVALQAEVDRVRKAYTADMKRLVLAEAKDEGFKAHAVCAPIAIESRATASPNFPRQ
jgi:hypothetical protein